MTVPLPMALAFALCAAAAAQGSLRTTLAIFVSCAQ